THRRTQRGARGSRLASAGAGYARSYAGGAGFLYPAPIGRLARWRAMPLLLGTSEGERRVRKAMILSTAVLALLVGAAVAMAANTVTLTVQAVPNKASTKKKIRPIKLAINVGITDPTQAQPTPLKQVIIRF